MSKINLMKNAIDFLKSIPKESKILLGCSGGVDSMVLLHILKNMNFDIGLAHFNHNIRSDSHQDQELVSNTAIKYNIPFHLKSMDVIGYCDDMNVSIELGARHLRQEFLNSIKDQYYFVATGHHSGDAVESMLYNLFRGSGVQGLSSMKQLDDKRKIIRPLLNNTKTDIYNYAKENGVNWREDSTNSESDYDRNFIRNEVIPLLETRRDGVSKVLQRSTEYFGKVTDFLQLSIDNWLKQNYNNSSFSRIEFMNQHELLRGEILKFIWNEHHENGFTEKVLHEVDKWLKNGNGGSSIYFGNNKVLYLKNNIVTVKEKNV